MEVVSNNHHIILVHGAGHGAWCWYKVATTLRQSGYRVTVPDLAASGIDARRHEEVSGFDEYVRPLMDVVAAVGPGERVVLVGHSFGGICVAAAADRFPEKVAVAVFLTAFRPDCTRSPSYVLSQQFIRHPTADGFWLDCRFDFNGAAVDTSSPSSVLLGPKYMQSRLYQLCPHQDVTLATTLVRASPTFPELKDAPPFSTDRYGSVPSIFIVCRKDLGILEDFQRWMIENHPVREVMEIAEADHMPMMSTPSELCELIMRIAEDSTCSVVHRHLMKCS